MRSLVLAAILLSLPTEAAACHHYSRWFYPWRQSCFFASHASHPLLQIRNAQGTERAQSVIAGNSIAAQPPERDMPLPSLTDADWSQGAIDDQSRGRLLLRAILEAPNAH